VILCAVKNERQLQKELDFFRSHGIMCEAFFEPDIGDRMTAFASEPVSGDQRELFRRGQLCKVSDFCSGGVPMTPNELQLLMQQCPQTPTQSVWQHGESVRDHYNGIVNGSIEGIKSPSWLGTYRTQVVEALHPITTSAAYCLWHDCGKPFCRVEDNKGTHFPEHASVSRIVCLDTQNDRRVADLIGWDMAIHTATAVEIDAYLQKWSRADACTLLIAALAEVHSNARMFGGIESTSFKIKFKQVEKRRNRICKFFFENQQ